MIIIGNPTIKTILKPIIFIITITITTITITTITIKITITITKLNIIIKLSPSIKFIITMILYNF